MHSNANQLFRIQDRVHKGNIFGGCWDGSVILSLWRSLGNDIVVMRRLEGGIVFGLQDQF